jgi:mutator protein MutT
MEPIRKIKKELAGLFPYRRRGEEFEYFVQKRTADAPRLAGLVGSFGGHFEQGEDILAAISREIQEELEYVPKNAQYFSRYEYAYGVIHIFIEEVGQDFESEVHVHEGDYGKFMTLIELKGVDMTPVGGVAVREIDEYLNKEHAEDSAYKQVAD